MAESRSNIENVIMLGNPGSGKSTILSAMIGRNAFPRGISIGTGMTVRFVAVVDNQIRHIDTPGLDDALKREQAAEEMRLALQQDGYYRIIFVVTLEAGRVKNADKATIRLVLNAARQITTSQYSIIVNKVTNGEARLLADPNQFSLLKTALFSELPAVTDRIFLNKLDFQLLDDTDDQLMNMSNELRRFLREAPRIQVNSGEVSYIKWDEFERTIRALEETHRRLQESEEEVKRERARFDKEIADAKAAEKARVDKAIADEKARVIKAIADEKARFDEEIADAKAAEKARVDKAIADEKDRVDKAIADEKARFDKEIADAKAAEKARVDKEIADEKARVFAPLIDAPNQALINEFDQVAQRIPRLPVLEEAISRHLIYRKWHFDKMKKGKKVYKKTGQKHSDCIIQQDKYIAGLRLEHSQITADAVRLGLIKK